MSLKHASNHNHMGISTVFPHIRPAGIFISCSLQMRVLLENTTFPLHKAIRIAGIIRVAGIIWGRALYEEIGYTVSDSAIWKIVIWALLRTKLDAVTNSTFTVQKLRTYFAVQNNLLSFKSFPNPCMMVLLFLI